MEKEGLGTAFWLENFGEVEIRYFPDEKVHIDDALKVLIKQHALTSINRILESIEGDKNDER